MLPLDERSCRSARGRSAKVRKITDSTFESAMAEHPDRRESSDRGRSSTSEYGYIGSSTKTGREERAFQHGGTSPDSSQKKGGKAIPTTPSSTHTDRV